MGMFVHSRIVGRQKTSRANRAHGLLPEPAVHVRNAFQLQRSHMLDRMVDGERLDSENLNLSDDAVRGSRDRRPHSTRCCHRADRRQSARKSSIRSNLGFLFSAGPYDGSRERKGE
jgi:hypothetical protein